MEHIRIVFVPFQHNNKFDIVPIIAFLIRLTNKSFCWLAVFLGAYNIIYRKKNQFKHYLFEIQFISLLTSILCLQTIKAHPFQSLSYIPDSVTNMTPYILLGEHICTAFFLFLSSLCHTQNPNKNLLYVTYYTCIY